MDKLISVLIADDNVEYGNLLREYLDNCNDLIVKGTARDGLETIEMIREHEPDIIILDLIMPNLDGIGVLERLSDLRLKSRPTIIVLSAVGQDSFIQKAVQLGAEYYMVKPFDVDMLVKRIRQLYGERHTSPETGMHGAAVGATNLPENSANNLEVIVTGLIRSMGIIPNIAGFHYLREAVILSVENPGMLVSVTRNIYPVIASRHNTTAGKVNRAIRSAIENSSGKFSEQEGKIEIAAVRSEYKVPVNTKLITFLSSKAKQFMNEKIC